VNNRKPEEKPPNSYLDHVMASGGTGAVSSLDSLSRALNVGFRVLRVLMAVLAVVFCFSNIYWVPEGFVAVQARFGKIVGEKGTDVRLPGGPYLAFPYPIDKVVRIPTGIQKVSVFKAFWSETDPFESTIDDRPETTSLRPGTSGSLLTADKNIVQGIWIVHYKLDTDSDDRSVVTAADFVRYIGSMERAAEILRLAAQSAIVRVVAQTEVADFVSGHIDNQAIKHFITTRLDQLQAGLTVTGVTASQYAVPKILMADFQAVNQSESQKALSIEKASRQRVSTLNELAGSGWQELLYAIEKHEQALEKGYQAAEEVAFGKARDIMLAGDVGGAVGQIIDEAKSEKTATTQRARAATARFTELLPEYDKHGEVLKAQLLQDAILKIWSDITVDALYLPPGQKLVLDLGNSNNSINESANKR
jgi:regulator of protease activity HflC (stomatin/prohibitin superfamily)